MSFLNHHRLTFAVLGGLLTVAAVLVLIIPGERTLGDGLRIVFIHAALIQTGAIGLIGAGLLGLAAAFSGREGAAGWARTVGAVALTFYFGGIATSLIAAQINWGGLGLDEPRMAAGLRTLAVAAIVQVLAAWLPASEAGRRLDGLLRAALATFLVWATASAPLVLHPRNPIGASPSLAIQASFYALLATTLLAAGWVIVRLRRADRASAG